MSMYSKYKKAQGDCDDTMILKLETAVDEGYPKDMMSGNFYLVPPSEMTGVRDVNLGGHAVATFQRKHHVPIAMEQIGMPRDVAYLEDTLGYYCVGFQTLTDDWRSEWKHIDKEGYEMLDAGMISVDEAKARPAYKNHTAWTHSMPSDMKPIERPSDGNTFAYFEARANEMYAVDPEKYERYFAGAVVKRMAGSVNQIAQGRQWDGIVVHMSDSAWGTEKDVYNWHVNGNGWNDTGYHFVITNDNYNNQLKLPFMDGAVSAGRNLSKRGAHTRKGYNDTHIGICLMHNSKPTRAQAVTLFKMCESLMHSYDFTPNMLIGHNEVQNKTCPGFSVNTLREALMWGDMHHFVDAFEE